MDILISPLRCVRISNIQSSEVSSTYKKRLQSLCREMQPNTIVITVKLSKGCFKQPQGASELVKCEAMRMRPTGVYYRK